MKKLGIVTVNYRSLKYTLQFVEGISKSIKDFVLVVVNNSPEDNDRLLEESSEFIIIINTNDNHGYSGGLNIGIDYLQQNTDSDWILLINNDVKLTKSFFNDLMSLEDENTVFSPTIVNIHNDIVQNTGGKLNIWIGGALNINKGKKIHKTTKTKPDFLSGCCLFMSMKVLDKVGKLNDNYGSYCEDMDFSYRAIEKGVKLEVLWDTILRHYHSMSTKSIPGYKDFLITRNLLWFAKKNLKFPRRQILIFNSIVVGFFTILTRPQNLSFFFKGVIEGLK